MGNDNFYRLKQITKYILKKVFQKFTIILCIISIIILLISGFIYYITIDDASYKEDDWSSTPYASEEYISNIQIDGNGNISSSMTAQELWDKMIENGSRVDEYLDGPEDLLKLMNAEAITQFLDTRKNPEEEIDWDSINDINSSEIQGIIKLKRAKEDGTVSYLTYVDSETFQMYIDNYNETGSDEDKQKALSHFTLEKGYVSSSSRNRNNYSRNCNSNSRRFGFISYIYGMANDYGYIFNAI